MTKNKEKYGRCELCGTRGKVKGHRKYGHNWKLCKTCRENKKTDKKLMAVLELGTAIDGEIPTKEKVTDKALITLKEIEEIDRIIKLIKDLRDDARSIVVAYRNMLLELESIRLELQTE